MDPTWLHDLLAMIKGFRNGVVYGAKVRFPHALVMTFLFQSGTLESKLSWIIRATKQHAMNLGSFVVVYKLALMLLRRYIGGGTEEQWHSFAAGVIGGFLIFRHENGINTQIVLYLFSRVAMALLKTFYQKMEVGSSPVGAALLSAEFPLKAALCWGLVMWLFTWHPSTLQSSLHASMTYLYKDSEHWSCLKDFLFVNKLE